MSRTRILKIAISLLLLSSLISCDGSGQAAGNETWSLVKLISKGEPRDNVVPETIEVRNCVVPETKTTDCSAGTSNSLSIDFGVGVEFGEGVSGSIDSSVSSSLGIGQQSGQSISLDVPPSGYFYTYEVEKRFSVISGEAVARSSNSKEQTVSYVFNASCSITIVSREQAICSNTGQNTGGDSNGSSTNQTSSTTRVLEVKSNQGWQASDVYISKGNTVHIVYQSGQWRVADWAEFTDGQGYPRFEGYAPEIAHGALIAQIDNGPILSILNEAQFTADRDGIISFRINDSDAYLYDNVGSITIMINVNH
jgi:hypothetical protein